MLLDAYGDTILAIAAKTRQHSHISIAVDLVLEPPGHPEKMEHLYIIDLGSMCNTRHSKEMETVGWDSLSFQQDLQTMPQ
jgi:hypothetical protein